MNKDFKWLCYCIATIESETNESEYKAFLDALNNTKSMFDAKCVIQTWYCKVMM